MTPDPGPSATPASKEDLARRLAAEMGIPEQELLARIAAPAPLEAPGLKKGVVVRRVFVAVKPGQEPPPQAFAAAPAALATKQAKSLDGRLAQAGQERQSVFERLQERDAREFDTYAFWQFLKRVPSWTLSILLHLLLIWLMMQMVWYTKVMREKVFTVFLGEPGGMKKNQDQGTKGDQNEKPPEVKTDIPPTETAAPVPTETANPNREPVVSPGASQTSTQPASGVPAEVQGRGGAGKGDLLKKYGGSEFSEQAVHRGLQWLVKHQETSGEWSAVRWDRHCPTNDRCGGVAEEEYTSGLTGLSLLCFLGAGHTHKDGEFADTVRRALNYLRRMQTPEGLFDEPLRRNMYNHAICTLAVSEAFALTQNAELGRMAQQALTFICRAQQTGGGWDYTDFQTDRNDLSISGWCIMALKSGRLAGLTVPWESWDRAKKLVLKATTADGRVKYADKAPHIGRLGDGLTAVGLACRYYMGIEDKAVMDRGARHLMENLPLWRKLKTSSTDTTFYYWYYGTLALFQRGGADWERWNESMRDMLIKNQRKEGHAEGSWDPDDAWIGPYAGRLYSTTLNILNLEVYYRYLPLYLAEQMEARPASEPGTVHTGKEDPRAVGELTHDKNRTPDELLIDLQTRDTLTRWKAARSLAEIGDQRAVPILLNMIPGMDATSRAMFIEVLGRFNDTATIGFIAGYLDDANSRVKEAALNALRKFSGKGNEAEVRKWLTERPR